MVKTPRKAPAGTPMTQDIPEAPKPIAKTAGSKPKKPVATEAPPVAASAGTASTSSYAQLEKKYNALSRKLADTERERNDLLASIAEERTRTQHRLDDLSRHVIHLNDSLIAQANYARGVALFPTRSGDSGNEAPLFQEIGWWLNHAATHGFKVAYKRHQAYRFLKSQRLVNESFYRSQLEVADGRPEDLTRHYVTVGAARGLDPAPYFSSSRYLTFYPDVKASGIDPFYHFKRFGQAERRVAVPSAVGYIDTAARSLNQFYAARPAEAGTPRRVELEDRTGHDWPVAANPKVDPAKLGLYDIRPEDAIPREGDTGGTFLSRFGLLSDTPDFAGAVEHLNAMTAAAVIDAGDEGAVDVSILIPIYGQLSYTLNCLHALLLHKTRYSFEILVGDDVSPDESARWLPELTFIRYVRHEKNGGFILNCNRTSALARGGHIVLLNNDTRVVADWLDELIDSFALFPKAGIVGSKLFYPDGSLQEAGGIIWRDGSAWNYGRNDDPNRPRYCCARQVDYISGCSIALPISLWREMGGFDEIYIPAYSEDSDLFFRVRAAGYETWLQPTSRVIHYEGKTSGTDVKQGAKAYQIRNHAKFFERWKDVLATHRENGEDPWFEKDRGVTKRALVVDALNPTPWMDAGSVKATTHIRIYQALGYKVHFVPQDNFLYEARPVKTLQRLGIECGYAPYELFFSEYMKKYGHLFDIIQVFRFEVAEKCLADIRRYAPQAKLVFANMDMHFLRLEREARLANDAKALEHAEAIRKRELDLISSVDFNIIHSPVEVEILKTYLPDAPYIIFPFMTDYIGTSAEFESRKDIMFLGGYNHGPNVDAVEFFTDQVWPLVKDKIPDANYLIVGAKPTEKVRSLAGERIKVTGMVDELAPWFDRCRVFVATIRYGAGVKGKVSTSMAHGLPVVATDCAAEGMFLVDGESVVIANEADDIAAAILRLYDDEPYWQKVSDASLQFVKEKNSFEMGVRTIRTIIERLEEA